MQIDYDPSRISYGELLDIFWNSHYPVAEPGSRQYMSIIFYHNEEQERLALESKAREEARLNRPFFTEIVPASEFFLAEQYHQKYYLRQVPELLREFAAIYPNAEDFIASTAAARVNGYLGGYGTPSALSAEIDTLGLSPEGKAKLNRIVSASAGKYACST